VSDGPKDASIQGDGFRFYKWIDPITEEETDLLSVTSIRKLCGTPYTLGMWQIANVIDVALGTMKRTVIGPRGGVSEKRLIESSPSEFMQRYIAADGQQPKIDELRKWVREQADQPRNIAAIRGTITHKALEQNTPWDRVSRPYVEEAFSNLSARDRKNAKAGVQDEDVAFVRNSVRQYWAMRHDVPFVIVAREPQVFNLTAGYGGSADALCWFLPEGWDMARDVLPKGRDLTHKAIESIGGYLAVGDWKTSKDVYVDQIVQVTAYGMGEFVGSGGVVDHRLTDILHATQRGVLFHIRPNKWAAHFFDFNQPVQRAFLGSVAFARFLATYPDASALFVQDIHGESDEEDDE
jgi:hypothetical protein